MEAIQDGCIVITEKLPVWDMQKEYCPNVKGADKADKVTVELPKTSVSNIGTKTEGKLVTVNGETYYQIETSKLGAFVVAESANLEVAIKAQATETDDEKLARIKKAAQNTTIKITKTSKGKGWSRLLPPHGRAVKAQRGW